MTILLPVAVFVMAIWWVGGSGYEALAVAFSVYTSLRFIKHVGQRIALPECIGFIATLEVLLVPALTYWVAPASMPVESTTYFSYALPACLAFYAGLNTDTWSTATTHREHIQAATAYLQLRQGASVTLLVIGLVGFLLKLLLPDLPAFLGALPTTCLLTSAFYAYYAGSGHRRLHIGLVMAVLLANTVQMGMFGDLFFWLLLWLLVISTGLANPPTVLTKTVVVVLAVAFLLLVQSVKREYRHHTWGYQRSERTADAGLMADLFTDRISHPEKLLSVGHLYTSFVRFNQGIMIGSAMAKVPVHVAYARGEVLLSLLYPFVPRLLWPGKPQTGGYENIRRFTALPQFENTSINISPLGEGYVNFGYGGVLFALLYGVVLGRCFTYVFTLAGRVPSAILWLPMLFIGCLTMETDLLSTWGSLVNSALFISGLFWLLKQIGIEL